MNNSHGNYLVQLVTIGVGDSWDTPGGQNHYYVEEIIVMTSNRQDAEDILEATYAKYKKDKNFYRVELIQCDGKKVWKERTIPSLETALKTQ